MKMKKTQSLKLMLLGLFALVSGSTLAQTYKAIEGVVYASYPAEGDNPAYATVVGVVKSALPAYNTTGKKITITDAVDGVNVTAFADGWTTGDWYQNGQYTALPEAVETAVTDPITGVTTYTNSQVAGSTSYTGYKTNDASDITGPVYMLIRASKMTSIKKADVQEFTIEKFTLGESCGILAIPDYLFAPMKVITSDTNLGKISNNNSEIEGLTTTLNNLQATQNANAEKIDFWTGVIAERLNNIDVAKSTTWWKTQEGQLKQLKDQKTALEKLRDIIKQLYATWSDASTTVLNAVNNGSKEGLTDAQQALYDDIVAAMVAANISPKVGGGYETPNLPGIIEQIEQLENTQIPEKEKYMNETAVFLKEGPQAMSHQNPKFSMKDLENLVQTAKDELAKVDKSDRIKEVSDQIKELQNKNKELEGDLSVLDPNGKNETLKQVNLYDQQLVTVGEGAFANCVNAKFGFKNDKFDAKIETIKALAFANTLLDNVDLSDATSDKLAVEHNAFYNTPLVTLKLQGVTSENITPSLVRAIVQQLRKMDKDIEYTDACGNVYKTNDVTNTNNTLKNVTLPTTEIFTEIAGRLYEQGEKVWSGTFEDCIALEEIVIPAQIEDIEMGAFENCVNLATVTFAGDKIARIERFAFFRTKVPAFDLSNQFKLAFIGDYAFAYNCQLTTVNLPADKDKYSYEQAPLAELLSNTFLGDINLTTVTFNGNMFHLAEGLFRSNKLADLDLSKTKVLVLNNLFFTGVNDPVVDENGDIMYAKDENGDFILDAQNKKIPLYQSETNKTLQSVTLPEGLLAINNFALSGLQGKDFKNLVIPTSVIFTGVGAFRNSSFLEDIDMTDTKLRFFERGTFEQCLKLETVELFAEEELYLPSMSFNTGTGTAQVTTLFTNPLREALRQLTARATGLNPVPVPWGGLEPSGFYPPIGDPTVEDPDPDWNRPFSYIDQIGRNINPDYNGQNQLGYIMAALGGDGWYDRITSEQTSFDPDYNRDVFNNTLWGFDDEWFDGRPNHEKVKVYVTPNDLKRLKAANYEEAYSQLEELKTTIKMSYIAPYSYGVISKPYGVWIPYKDGTVVFSAYQDGGNVIMHPAKIKNGYYKVAGYDPAVNAEGEVKYGNNYYWKPDGATWTDVELANTAADRASAAVIRVYGNVSEIEYIAQHSRDVHAIPAGMATDPEIHIAPRFQSTLDTENQLQILDENVYPTTNMNWYKFGIYGGEVNFWYVSSGKIAKGALGLNGEGVNGLSRLDIVWNEFDEATAVLGIKEYRDMMQNGTIYNLQGVKVTAPVKGQMYIQNGKKFIQK